MKLLVYIRTVLWGFFGVGGRAGEDLGKVKPLALVAVAAGLPAALGLPLVGLANLAVSTLQ